MKQLLFRSFTIVLFISITSCSIQKRQHFAGYHIEFHTPLKHNKLLTISKLPKRHCPVSQASSLSVRCDSSAAQVAGAKDKIAEPIQVRTLHLRPAEPKGPTRSYRSRLFLGVAKSPVDTPANDAPWPEDLAKAEQPWALISISALILMLLLAVVSKRVGRSFLSWPLTAAAILSLASAAKAIKQSHMFWAYLSLVALVCSFLLFVSFLFLPALLFALLAIIFGTIAIVSSKSNAGKNSGRGIALIGIIGGVVLTTLMGFIIYFLLNRTGLG